MKVYFDCSSSFSYIGLPLLAGNNGAIVVITSPSLELIPGDYDISILVSAGNVAQTFVNFTLHVGKYFIQLCMSCLF